MSKLVPKLSRDSKEDFVINWFPTFSSPFFLRIFSFAVSIFILVWVPLNTSWNSWTIAKNKSKEIKKIQELQEMTQEMRRITDLIDSKKILWFLIDSAIENCLDPLHFPDLEEAGKEISRRLAPFPSPVTLWLVKHGTGGSEPSICVLSPPPEPPFADGLPDRKGREALAALFLENKYQKKENYPNKEETIRAFRKILGPVFDKVWFFESVQRTLIHQQPCFVFGKNFPQSPDEREKSNKYSLWGIFIDDEKLKVWLTTQLKESLPKFNDTLLIDQIASIPAKYFFENDFPEGSFVARTLYENPDLGLLLKKRASEFETEYHRWDLRVKLGMLILAFSSFFGLVWAFFSRSWRKISLSQRIVGLFLFSGLFPLAILVFFVAQYHNEKVFFTGLEFGQKLEEKIQDFWMRFNYHLRTQNEVWKKIAIDVGAQPDANRAKEILDNHLLIEKDMGFYFYLTIDKQEVFNFRPQGEVTATPGKGQKEGLEKLMTLTKQIAKQQLVIRGLQKTDSHFELAQNVALEEIFKTFFSKENQEKYVDLVRDPGLMSNIQKGEDAPIIISMDFPRDSSQEIKGVLYLAMETDFAINHFLKKNFPPKFGEDYRFAFLDLGLRLGLTFFPKFLQNPKVTEIVANACVKNARVDFSGLSLVGRNYKGIAIPSSVLPGATLALEPEDEIIPPKWGKYVLFLSACIFILAGCGFILVNLLVHPLREVISTVRQVGTGNFDVQLNLTSSHEMRQLSIAFNNMTNSLRELTELKSFVSQSAIDILQASERGDILAGGERTHAAVLFCHIKGFDEICASQSPQEIVELLEEWFPIATQIISDNGGEVDKFIGDAVMGVFYAKNRPNYVESAAIAACEMSKAAKVLNGERIDRGKTGFLCGFGVSSGKLVAGRVGSLSGFLDYTVIGDTVNVAARLEALSLTSEWGEILATDDFVASLHKGFLCKDAGTFKLKGKASPQKIFEILGRDKSN